MWDYKEVVNMGENAHIPENKRGMAPYHRYVYEQARRSQKNRGGEKQLLKNGFRSRGPILRKEM